MKIFSLKNFSKVKKIEVNKIDVNFAAKYGANFCYLGFGEESLNLTK